jgi:hypothetical protein
MRYNGISHKTGTLAGTSLSSSRCFVGISVVEHAKDQLTDHVPARSLPN